MTEVVLFSLSRVWGCEALLPLAMGWGNGGTWGLFGLAPSATHKQRLGGQGGGGGGWISALQVTHACVCRSQTVPFQLTLHSEMVMAAPSARGMLLNGDLQHQEWALANWGGQDDLSQPCGSGDKQEFSCLQ